MCTTQGPLLSQVTIQYCSLLIVDYANACVVSEPPVVLVKDYQFTEPNQVLPRRILICQVTVLHNLYRTPTIEL